MLKTAQFHKQNEEKTGFIGKTILSLPNKLLMKYKVTYLLNLNLENIFSNIIKGGYYFLFKSRKFFINFISFRKYELGFNFPGAVFTIWGEYHF